jgi:tryptophan synthase alpha chain
MQALKTAGRKALVPYLVCGDPCADATVPAMHALVSAGADVIELGVPFSDPMAEGPVIQRAHERALAQRMSLRGTLDAVRRFRETDAETPVVLMGYANPVEVMGYAAFAQAASAVGVDGLLTVDMPLEEGAELNAALQSAGIAPIFLIAPTTSAERLAHICKAAQGYLYYVSLKGVTGAGHLQVDSVAEYLNRIRALTDKPVCVGFGIKDAASAKAIGALADGVVVGSALVDRLGAIDITKDVEKAAASISCDVIAPIRQALDALVTPA